MELFYGKYYYFLTNSNEGKGDTFILIDILSYIHHWIVCIKGERLRGIDMCVSELPTNQFNKRVSKKMALVGKLVNQIEIKTSAEKYYKLFKHHIHHLPDITPIFQQVTVHDGDWDSHGHGSIKVWNYTVGTFI